MKHVVLTSDQINHIFNSSEQKLSEGVVECQKIKLKTFIQLQLALFFKKQEFSEMT